MRLRVIQHNVLTWDTRKFDLNNTYRQLDADVILINSHGLRHDTRLKIPGYKIYQSNHSNEQMDGVAIAIKRHIKHKIDDEYISETLSVEVETSDGPLIIATSYLPPRRSYIPLPDYIRLFRRHTPVYLAGDLNARHTQLGHTSTNQTGRDLLNLIRHRNVILRGPYFPTYYGPLSSTTPDIVLTNTNAHYHQSITPGPLTTSDHIPVIIDISTSPILTPIPPTPSFKNADWDGFKNDDELDMTDLPNISHGSLEDIDCALETWTNRVTTVADRHIPKTRYRLDPHPRPSRQTQLTKIQFRALKEHAAQFGWTIDNYRRYTQLRLTLEESRREEARRFWGRTLAELAAKRGDPRVFWKRLRCLSGRNNGPETYLKDQQGNKQHTDQEKERLHTTAWARVFQADDDDHDANDNVLDFMRNNARRISPFTSADPDRLQGNTPLSCKISTLELEWALSGSKATCPGRSGINKTILSHLPQQAKERLRAIFNAALSAGYFPDAFKEAEMKMILKPGKIPTRPDSFRPISLLEVPGKLLERIVTRRLRDHMDIEDLNNPAQYGFRRGRGTTHAIAIATETLALHQASGIKCNLVLRDVAKAFDKVWHLGLKFKILHLGLPETMERFLCDFLEDRSARIRIGSHRGRPFPLESGVPQGSVLSPILYSIYTRDCPESVGGLNIQYADDVTQIVSYPGSRRILNARTDREVTRINAFEEEWRIKTNLAKFKAIPLAARNPPPLLVDGDMVTYSREGSLLGLKITSRGYTSHVTAKVSQAKIALARLFRFRDLDTNIKLHLVKALVIPILTYPPVPTHAFSKSAIRKLQRVQNKALKFAFNYQWDSFISMETLHEAAGIPALNVRLHLLATKVWDKLEAIGAEALQSIHQLQEECPDTEHQWFPRSLRTITMNPNPDPIFT